MIPKKVREGIQSLLAGRSPKNKNEPLVVNNLMDHIGKTPTGEIFQYVKNEFVNARDDDNVSLFSEQEKDAIQQLTAKVIAEAEEEEIQRIKTSKNIVPIGKSWADAISEDEELASLLSTSVVPEQIEKQRKAIIPSGCPELVNLRINAAALKLNITVEEDKKVIFSCASDQALLNPETLTTYLHKEADVAKRGGLKALLQLLDGLSTTIPIHNEHKNRTMSYFMTIIQGLHTANLLKDSHMRDDIEHVLPSLQEARSRAVAQLAQFVNEESAKLLVSSIETLTRQYLTERFEKATEQNKDDLIDKINSAINALAMPARAILMSFYRKTTKVVETIEKKGSKSIPKKELVETLVPPIIRTHGCETGVQEENLIKKLNEEFKTENLSKRLEDLKIASYSDKSKTAKEVVESLTRFTDRVSKSYKKHIENVRNKARELQNADPANKEKKELLTVFYSKANLELKRPKELGLLTTLNEWLKKKWEDYGSVEEPKEGWLDEILTAQID